MAVMRSVCHHAHSRRRQTHYVTSHNHGSLLSATRKCHKDEHHCLVAFWLIYQFQFYFDKMFNATVQRIRTPAFKITQNCTSKDCHSVLSMIPHGRRCLSTSSCLYGKILPRKKPRVVHEIAGLEPITYADRMHFVPGLAKPRFPTWDRGWKDPTHYQSPKLEDMPLHKDKPCYIFNQRTNVLEGSYSSSVYFCGLEIFGF